MVNISESAYPNYLTYNGNSANFEFFTSSGTVLPAWIESNTSGKLVTWVKLPNGIPAKSSITIYLGFASTSSNLLLLSGTSGIGEAPQLPCGSTATSSCSTYAEYDDGASVFSFYSDFKGNTLNTNKWNAIVTGDGCATYSVNNALTISQTPTSGCAIVSKNKQTSSIIESLILSGQNTNLGTAVGFAVGLGSDGSDNEGYWWDNGFGSTYVGRIVVVTPTSGWAVASVSYTFPEDVIIGGAWPITGNEIFYVNYAQLTSSSDTTIS